MKKKIIKLVFACAVCFAALFAMAGCDSSTPTEEDPIIGEWHSIQVVQGDESKEVGPKVFQAIVKSDSSITLRSFMKDPNGEDMDGIWKFKETKDGINEYAIHDLGNVKIATVQMANGDIPVLCLAAEGITVIFQKGIKE